MKRALLLLPFLWALACAQTAAEILDRVERNLQDPWQAVLRGSFRGPLGPEELWARVFALPREGLFRIEFQRPGSLEGNFTVITEREVWNYLYLTNQLIVTPRERAQVQGLGLSPQALVDPGSLLAGVGFRLLGEERLPEGAAWRLLGQAQGGQGFASLELFVLKSDPRPLRLVFRDEAGGVLADLRVAEFRRAPLRPQDLRRYPRDAQVIRR